MRGPIQVSRTIKVLLGSLAALGTAAYFCWPRSTNVVHAPAVTSVMPPSGPQPVAQDKKPTKHSKGAEPAPNAAVVRRELPVAIQPGRAADHAVVVESSGQPMPGAEVWLTQLDGSVRPGIAAARMREASVVLTTDQDGRTGKPDNLAGHLLVHVEKEGYGWAEDEWDTAAASTLRIVIQPTRRLSGYVVDQDNKPIIEASICRTRWPRGNEEQLWQNLVNDAFEETARSDQKGRFGFLMVDNRRQSLTASAPGFVTTRLSAVDPDASLKIALPRPATIFGRVTSEAGDGLAGAQIDLIITGIFPESRCATPVVTDKLGHFEVTDAPSGQVAIGYRCEGYASDRIEVTVPAKQRFEASHSLQRSVTISGRVIGTDGVPIPKININVINESIGTGVDLFITDDRGNFEITNVAEGKPYDLEVWPIRFVSGKDFHGVLGGSKGLDLVVDRCASLRGRVTFDGEPRKQISFRQVPLTRGIESGPDYQATEQPWALDLVDGRYLVSAMAGLIDVEARAEGYAPIWLRSLSIPIAGGEVQADLQFKVGGELQVRVSDAGTGKPLSNASVTILERAFTGSYLEGYGAIRAISDEQGLCRLDHVPEDIPAISVKAFGYGIELIRNPLQVADGSPPLLAITLNQGGSIEGTVDVPYMAPEMVVTVHARPIGWETGLSTNVDRERHYRIDDLPAGPVEVRLEDLLYTLRFRNTDWPARQAIVRSGEVTRLDWKGMAGVALKGEVKNFAGTAVIHAYALGANDEPAGLSGGAHTDVEHHFRIPGLRPGKYLLVGRSGEPGKTLCVARPVTITDDERECEVVLDVSPNVISGTVVAAGSDQPLSRARVDVFAEGTATTLAEAVVAAAPDGSFSIAGLGAGTYALRASYPGCGTQLHRGLRAPLELGRMPLDREALLAVNVEDDRGMPIVGATVSMQSIHSLRDEPEVAFSGAQGSCRFAALAASAWTLSARAPHHETTLQLVELAAGDDQRITLVLTRLGTLHIVARDPDGRPLTTAVITIVSAQGEDFTRDRPFVTDEQGALEVHDVAPGNYTIMYEPLALEQDASLGPGQTIDVVLGAGDAPPTRSRD